MHVQPARFVFLAAILVFSICSRDAQSATPDRAAIDRLFGDRRLGHVSLNWEGEDMDTEQVMDELLKWAEQMGILRLSRPEVTRVWPLVDESSHAKGKCFEGELRTREDVTLVSARTFFPDSTLLSLSPAVLVTSDDATAPSERFPDARWPYTDEEAAAHEDEDEEEEDWAAATTLAAWLLRERAKGRNSSYAPYIRSLPERVTLPALFSADLVRMLEKDSAIEKAFRMREVFEREYKRCDPAAIANATLNEFLWAMSIVHTRALPQSLCDAPPPPPPVAPPVASSGTGNETSASNSTDASSEPASVGGSQGREAEPQEEEKEEEENPPPLSTARSVSFFDPLVLVPLADFLNTDAQGAIRSQLRCDGNEFLVDTRGGVGYGVALNARYGDTATSEDFLVDYGFSPIENEADDIVLFENFFDLLNFYNSGFHPHRTINETFARTAKEVVEKVQNSSRASVKMWVPGLDLREDGRETYLMGTNGRVEPFVVTAMTALWLHDAGLLTDDHLLPIGEAAAKFTQWHIGLGDCKDLRHNIGYKTRKSLEETLEATFLAITAVRSRILSLKSLFHTELDRDTYDLRRLRACKGVPLGGQGDTDYHAAALAKEGCSAREMAEFQDRETILKFRMVSKVPFQYALHFIEEKCGAQINKILAKSREVMGDDGNMRRDEL